MNKFQIINNIFKSKIENSHLNEFFTNKLTNDLEKKIYNGKSYSFKIENISYLEHIEQRLNEKFKLQIAALFEL